MALWVVESLLLAIGPRSPAPAGFGRQRPLLRSCARVAIFDRQHHRFLGNVHEMPAAEASQHAIGWSQPCCRLPGRVWDVRHTCVQCA